MQYIKQKGQSIVEFSMILPIFFLIVFGFIYLAMFLIDYSTLNNFAANMARRTALGESITIEDQDIDNLLMLDSYYDFNARLTESDKISTVTIDATRKDLSSFILDSALPEQYSVSSSMEKIQLEPEVIEIENIIEQIITVDNTEVITVHDAQRFFNAFAHVKGSTKGYGTIVINGEKYAIVREGAQSPWSSWLGIASSWSWNEAMEGLFDNRTLIPEDKLNGTP